MSGKEIIMKVVYRLGPPLPPTFHRDPLPTITQSYFNAGAFYCVGTIELANEWRGMCDDTYFESRPLFKITLKDDAVVIFLNGWMEEEKVADDLTETIYTDFGDGPVLDPESCQLIAKLSDIISVKEVI